MFLKVKSYDSSPCQLFLTLLATNWCQYSRHILRKSPLLLKKIMRLSHDNLLTHLLGKVPYTSWLFTIYKKIPEILVGNFGSVKTVRVVHHLPKISGLSRRASRLDSNYNLMHQSIAAAPSPPPPGYCGPFARLVSPVGWAFANFVLPGAIPELLTRTRFPIRI